MGATYTWAPRRASNTSTSFAAKLAAARQRAAPLTGPLTPGGPLVNCRRAYDNLNKDPALAASSKWLREDLRPKTHLGRTGAGAAR